MVETKNSFYVCESSTLSFSTTAGTDVIDITHSVAEKVAGSGIAEGQALVFTPGSTAALTTIEYESGVVRDLIEAALRRKIWITGTMRAGGTATVMPMCDPPYWGRR
jgi:hypothetical protein